MKSRNRKALRKVLQRRTSSPLVLKKHTQAATFKNPEKSQLKKLLKTSEILETVSNSLKADQVGNLLVRLREKLGT